MSGIIMSMLCIIGEFNFYRGIPPNAVLGRSLDMYHIYLLSKQKQPGTFSGDSITLVYTEKTLECVSRIVDRQFYKKSYKKWKITDMP